MTDETAGRRGPFARHWPWLVLALATVPAIWHFVDFPDDVDGEYPAVARPTFSARPPSAYRLAEPGDTIDRVGLYVASTVVVLAALGWAGASRPGLWPAAMALGASCGWYAATPGPTYDGWHGLGWRAIVDPSAPWRLRVALAAAALTLAGVAAASLRTIGRGSWLRARERGALTLLLASGMLLVGRFVEWPGAEPVGYWPRWMFAWGLMAFALALVRLSPPLPGGPWRRSAARSVGLMACLALIAGGLRLIWLHRPLERLRTVVPGRIYVSAMPTKEGLEVEHARLGFRTIINLFPEESDRRSPRLPDELAFAREHGIRYLGSPGNVLQSDTFLDETLALAREPDAWPILVHCHGCMDRTPAWMGIYRFVVQGRPLLEILREIEAHRGVRPKASVTLLYNRVLPPRAPDRYAADPTAAVLREAALGTVDPFDRESRGRTAATNPRRGRRVARE